MAAARKAKRPRVWVPGVAYVTDEHELDCGRHAGFNGWGKAFQASPCGHFGDIRQWRHRVWLVDRADLDDKKIAEHAIILPETLLDPDQQPHARRWLSEQPLLCVSGMKVDRLTGAGLRIYQVEHGVDGDDLLAVGASGGGRAPWMFRGRIADMVPAEATDPGPGLAREERRELRELVDRLLSQLSRGVLREQSVANAMAVRTLIEPGYGYRGETAGVPASIDEVQSKLRALEALFRQIDERAGGMRADARELARSVAGAGVNQASLRELPIYGSADRLGAGELTIRLQRDGAEGPAWEVAGEPRGELVLPLEPRWVVDRVDLWSPTLPADLARQLEREQERTGRGLVIAVLLLVLIVGVLAGVWLAPELVR